MSGLLIRKLAGIREHYTKSLRATGCNAEHIIAIMKKRPPGTFYKAELTFIVAYLKDRIGRRLPTKDENCFNVRVHRRPLDRIVLKY